ncbi:MAG: helix-turn-helix domain-containing protein [Flavobacteriaceae bacterium]|nr:helix-turn-helix domain-containing protein [Flavobacteriaceae bacterium]
MTYKERQEKTTYLLELIEKGCVLSLNQIAQKFNCSRRTVKRMIADLKEQGHTINYCRKTYKFLLKK